MILTQLHKRPAPFVEEKFHLIMCLPYILEVACYIFLAYKRLLTQGSRRCCCGLAIDCLYPFRIPNHNIPYTIANVSPYYFTIARWNDFRCCVDSCSATPFGGVGVIHLFKMWMKLMTWKKIHPHSCPCGWWFLWMDETDHMDENGPYFMALNIHIPWHENIDETTSYNQISPKIWWYWQHGWNFHVIGFSYIIPFIIHPWSWFTNVSSI